MVSLLLGRVAICYENTTHLVIWHYSLESVLIALGNKESLGTYYCFD